MYTVKWLSLKTLFLLIICMFQMYKAADGYSDFLNSSKCVNNSISMASLFSITDFGAVGDGKTDNSKFIQKTIDAATRVNGTVIVTQGVFLVKRTIIIKNGLKEMVGKGGIIKAGGPITLFKLAGIHSKLSENVKGLRIHNLKIDADKQKGANGVRGIVGENSSDCSFFNNYFYNFSHGFGILLLSYSDGVEACQSNKIERNTIKGESGITKDKTNLRWYPLSISSNLDLPKGQKNSMDYYKSSGIAVEGKLKGANNIIRENNLSGGYYGINLISTYRTIVKNNTVANNVRNISMQWGCTKNKIYSNILLEAQSSSILCGYGSNRNKISRNKIKTSCWIGEGLIKVGLASSNNCITKNTTETDNNVLTGEYHIYIFIDSDNITVKGNILKGDCAKAYIGIETAWNTSLKDIAHFAGRKNSVVNGFAHKSMNNISIKSNTITAISVKTIVPPAIYIGQIEDSVHGIMSLNNCKIRRNKVTSDKHSNKMKVLEMNKENLTFKVKRNSFEDTSIERNRD